MPTLRCHPRACPEDPWFSEFPRSDELHARREPSTVEAAQAWIGKHDFSAFRDARCEAKSPERTISFIQVRREGHILFVFEARSFLHHQVRIMAGTLVEIGRGAKAIAWAKERLDGRIRAESGPAMPAHGLSLDFIGYPEDLFAQA